MSVTWKRRGRSPVAPNRRSTGARPVGSAFPRFAHRFMKLVASMPNRCMEFAPAGRPTRKSDALLLAAHARL
jgi:hypothetical protein